MTVPTTPKVILIPRMYDSLSPQDVGAVLMGVSPRTSGRSGAHSRARTGCVKPFNPCYASAKTIHVFF